MASRKIIWSQTAKRKLYSTLEFYNQRNESKTYSLKLYKKFQKELSLLKVQSNIGIKTDLENVRGLIVDDFILFYEIKSKIIIVHNVWDSRQNPDSLKFK